MFRKLTQTLTTSATSYPIEGGSEKPKIPNANENDIWDAVGI